MSYQTQALQKVLERTLDSQEQFNLLLKSGVCRITRPSNQPLEIVYSQTSHSICFLYFLVDIDPFEDQPIFEAALQINLLPHLDIPAGVVYDPNQEVMYLQFLYHIESSTVLPENVLSKLDSLANQIRSELENEKTNWR